MSLLARPHYVSEITQFIDALKAKKPSLQAEQQAGRALLWDRQVDTELAAEYAAARVAQQPYVYGSAEKKSD